MSDNLPKQAGWALEMHGELVLFANNAERERGMSPGATTPVFTADQMLAFRAEGVAEERERIRAALMDMHRKTVDHNYYAYAANMLFNEPTPGAAK